MTSREVLTVQEVERIQAEIADLECYSHKIKIAVTVLICLSALGCLLLLFHARGVCP